MDFYKLCKFRDSVIEVNYLNSRIETERKFINIKSPSLTTTKNTMKHAGNPTEKHALQLIELTEELEAKKAAVAAQAKEAEAYINEYCQGEPEACEMLKLYYIFGRELLELKQWGEEVKFPYDILSTIHWFFKVTTPPKIRTFFLENERFPNEGEI